MVWLSKAKAVRYKRLVLSSKGLIFSIKYSSNKLEPPSHLRYVMTFTAIVIAVFGYDLFASSESDRSKRIEEVKKVVDDSVSSAARESKKQMMMQRYIERRAEVNKVTDLD